MKYINLYYTKGFVGLLKKHVDKKITIIIDNASINKAKAMQPLMSILEAEGVTLHFLSPYSPVNGYQHRRKSGGQGIQRNSHLRAMRVLEGARRASANSPMARGAGDRGVVN